MIATQGLRFKPIDRQRKFIGKQGVDKILDYLREQHPPHAFRSTLAAVTDTEVITRHAKSGITAFDRATLQPVGEKPKKRAEMIAYVNSLNTGLPEHVDILLELLDSEAATQWKTVSDAIMKKLEPILGDG